MKLTDFIMLLVEDDPNDILLIQRAFAKACLVNPLKVVRDGEHGPDGGPGAGVGSAVHVRSADHYRRGGQAGQG